MTEDFLTAYKFLERELGDKSVYEYENSLPQTENERLKVCRLMRNYMVHNDSWFLEATEEQVKFLEDLSSSLRSSKDIVEKHMVKTRLVKSDDIETIIKRVSKNCVCPVTNSKSTYLVDSMHLVKSLGKKEVPSVKTNFVSPDDEMKNIRQGFSIVTSDGTKNGKYLGFVERK